VIDGPNNSKKKKTKKVEKMIFFVFMSSYVEMSFLTQIPHGGGQYSPP
jgi:hypothetical protein